MARKSDAPTRSEVTDTVEKHKDDMSEKIEELDLIATDSETVRETLESLEFDGTAEGGDAGSDQDHRRGGQVRRG